MNKGIGFAERDWPEPKPQKDVKGYTKGEWRIEEIPDNKLCVYSKLPNGFHYGICNVLNGVDKQANANLIAAAPDNYEANLNYDNAIGRAIIALNSSSSLTAVVTEILLPSQIIGRKALTKAEGK